MTDLIISTSKEPFKPNKRLWVLLVCILQPGDTMTFDFSACPQISVGGVLMTIPVMHNATASHMYVRVAIQKREVKP